MGLTQLEMFNAVTTTGSITQAIQKVHRVSSNLTTCVRQLETNFGVELFTRGNQRPRLSPAGHSFLRYSQQILVPMDEARVVVAGDGPQGLFSLGSLESTVAVRIPTTLTHFNQRYPKIHLALFTGPSRIMINDMLEDALGAAFANGPLVHPDPEGLPVFLEEMTIVVPYDYAPVNRISGVNGANVYALRADCSYHWHFESWFHANRTTLGRIHKMGSCHGMLVCVIAGTGLALIPRSTLENTPGHQQVSAWSLAEEWRWLITWLVWRRGVKTRQLKMFIALLNEGRQTTVSPWTR